jgi:predicted transcriptional regulator
LKILSPARLRVFRAVKQQREISITSLAKFLNRPREVVSRDVKALTSVGLVKVRAVSNPGHGRTVLVSSAADRVFVEL